MTGTLDYQPGKEVYDVQLGGTLDMTGIWSNYNTFRTLYIVKNGKAEFYKKSLTGQFQYQFQVNPDVVTVNEEILCSPAAWQTAFETESQDTAAAFFSYMHCVDAAYDAATGTVTVTFRINENGSGKVSTKTIDDNKDAGSKPDFIHAYSPAGAFTIKVENFKKGQSAFVGKASFTGNMDLSPWMALIFPLRYTANVTQDNLLLNVPDAKVTFDVENGTWADGTADTRVATVPVDVFKLSEGAHVVAGTLTEDMIPVGMIAAEGYDQENGAWDQELVTEENGLVFRESGLTTMSRNGNDSMSIGYTYSFPGKAADPKPVDPDQPAFPGEDDNNKPGEDNKPGDTDKPGEDSKPGDTDADKPGTDKPEENKPVDNTNKQEENKKPSSSKVPTAAATGIAATLGVQALSVAGIFTLLRRRKNR